MKATATKVSTIAVGTIGAFALLWWGFAASKTEVTVAVAERGSVAEVVYATGVVEPVYWAKIAAPQRKRIVELCKCEGAQVSAGEVLVRLDDAEERAELKRLEARLERLKLDLQRIKVLVDRNVTTRVTYDEALTRIYEHEARIEAQKDRISDLQLKSPIDGMVLRRDGEVGEIAGIVANQTIIAVGKTRPLHVVADINEDDISKVKLKQKVFIRHQSHAGSPLGANVSRVTPQGDPNTKTFRAYLVLPDDTPLMIGMSVEANILVKESLDSLILPAEAVQGSQIQLVSEDRVEVISVGTGTRGTRFVEITSGLSEGDLVVSPFVPELHSDARIKITSAD